MFLKFLEINLYMENSRCVSPVAQLTILIPCRLIVRATWSSFLSNFFAWNIFLIPTFMTQILTVNPQTRQNSSSLNQCFLKSFGMKLLLILRNYPVLVQHYVSIFNWKECSLDMEIKRTIPTIKYLRNDKWSLKS